MISCVRIWKSGSGSIFAIIFNRKAVIIACRKFFLRTVDIMQSKCQLVTRFELIFFSGRVSFGIQIFQLNISGRKHLIIGDTVFFHFYYMTSGSQPGYHNITFIIGYNAFCRKTAVRKGFCIDSASCDRYCCSAFRRKCKFCAFIIKIVK